MNKVSVERFILIATVIFTVGFIITGLLISTVKQDGVGQEQIDFDNAIITDDYSDAITDEELILESMQTTTLEELIQECYGRCKYNTLSLKVGDVVRIRYSDRVDSVYLYKVFEPEPSDEMWTSLLIVAE